MDPNDWKSGNPGQNKPTEYRGKIDIRIARDGTWFHEGTPIRRRAITEYFSTILRKGSDGNFYLVTSAEKWRIEVEDAPFMAIDVEADGSAEQQDLVFTTNVGDQVTAGVKHMLRVALDPDTQEPAPYIMVRDGLEACINRSTFYRLVGYGVEKNGQLVVWSNGSCFVLGDLE